MTTIYKYPLEVTLNNITILDLPKNAEFLFTGFKDGNINLWFQVNTENKLEKRKFAVYGTGHILQSPEYSDYLGSVIVGGFVWHVFEEPHLPR